MQWINGIKQTGWLIIEVIGVLVLSAIFFFLITSLISLSGFDIQGYYTGESPFDYPYQTMLVQYIPLVICVLLAMILVHHIALKRDIREFGFDPKGILRQTFIGCIFAVIILAAGFIILYLTGGLTLLSTDWDSRLVFGFLMLFIFQSAFEELFGRSYLIPTIERRFNVATAIVASSLLFALVHLGNDHVSPFAFLNIFLAGALMGILFIRTRKLWAPLGFHAAWNFIQGSVLGFGVSGIEVYSILDTQETGNDLFTGGPFGFEGSLLSSLGLLIGCYFAWKMKPRENTPDLPEIPEDRIEYS